MWPATVTLTTGMSVPAYMGHGGALGTAGHDTLPAAVATHCSTHTPEAHVHPLAVEPSRVTIPPSSYVTRGAMLLESAMFPHVPRFWSVEAARAPSRAAFVII